MKDKFEYKVFIPKLRRNLLTDKNIKMIEDKTGVSIEINYDGEVVIRGEDSYKCWVCENIVKAIGRGFNFDKALILLNENYALELIDINDYAKNLNNRIRLKGRVIGKQGRVKAYLERLTGCSIVVYGKTVGVICDENTLPIARNAVQMILEGAKQSTAYKYVEKQLKKQSEF